jgi:hypothetical protein
MCPAIVDSWPNYVADFILVHSYRFLTVRIPLSLQGQTPVTESVNSVVLLPDLA